MGTSLFVAVVVVAVMVVAIIIVTPENRQTDSTQTVYGM